MRSVFFGAAMLLCLSVSLQADPITETSCESIDTAESCNALIPDTPVLNYGIDSTEVRSSVFISGSIFDPDINYEESDNTRVTFSYTDHLEFSFVVLGGAGSGVMYGVADAYTDTTGPAIDTYRFSLSGNYPNTGSVPGEPFPITFTYGEPITYSIAVDYFVGGRSFVTMADLLGFSIRAPEGAYFEEYHPPVAARFSLERVASWDRVAATPEPATIALLPAALAGLYGVRRLRRSKPWL